MFVFEFNERAIRTYKRSGFVIEGRARESIFRDGRWWDELAMSVLESDWRRLRAAEIEDDTEREGLREEAEAVGAETVASAARPTGDLIRRTVRRFS